MSQSAISLDESAVEPDVSHLVTEDDAPVDNLFSETLQRLLTVCLYSSWLGLNDRSFLTAANVGVFYAVRQPPLVPDVFLSLGVQAPQDWRDKQNRAYFVWEFGKPPDVVIEIVSNREGNELGSKLRDYARIGVAYYVVFDPLQQLSETLLHIYELQGNSYEAMSQTWLEKVGLGLTLWEGEFEGKQAVWLRWCDRQGEVLPTGDERASLEQHRAEQQQQRAEQAEAQLAHEQQRAQQLAERLRALGVDPDQL
ncbi:Uma2 family endonuclease [Leptolyngbya sp. FACHB-261]|uniref:Uma2 family endonuclease n=1 Tax=Leptolyngbya sp. FACHB-261 TaxID=2692806 RepID=UPI0016884065|nr:Uma2 family endonuclease [Leptolyngbya sp. FACHB-261]MBD2102182.1 Uma2 family endonuclease [Leptolyngbya sp. FACHB-261]